MEICGVEARVFNNSKRACQRAKNHKGAVEGKLHNFFSDTCPVCGREGCDGNGTDCDPPLTRAEAKNLNYKQQYGT